MRTLLAYWSIFWRTEIMAGEIVAVEIMAPHFDPPENRPVSSKVADIVLLRGIPTPKKDICCQKTVHIALHNKLKMATERRLKS